MDANPIHEHSPNVRQLYQLGAARWYDPFRVLWTQLTSRAAEAEFDRLLREVATEGCRLVDLGCGTGYNLGRLLRLAIPFGSYRGIDLTEAMLDIARARHRGEPRATFERADLYDLAKTADRFDLVLCTWVASHLEQPRDVFEIAHRVLVPGGHALFLTLTRPHWHIAWWLTPFVRLFQARYVPPEMLRDLPGLEMRRTWTAGLITLVHLKRGAESPAY